MRSKIREIREIKRELGGNRIMDFIPNIPSAF